MDDKEELIRTLKAAFDRVGTTFDDSAKTLAEYSAEVNKGRRSILTLGPALKDMRDAIVDQEEALGKLEKGTVEHTKTSKKLDDTQKTYQTTLKKFVEANIMNGFADAIVKGGAAFLTGTRDMAFTAIRGFQSGADSIAAASDVFAAEMERNANMARAGFEAMAAAGSAIPLKLGVAAELAGKAGLELTNQIYTINKEGLNVLNTELTKTKVGFVSMATAGAYFTGGMTEMRNMASQTGLRLEDFAQVAQNAGGNLRLFGASQADALKQVGKVTNTMGSQVNAQLRNIGYSQAEIAEGTAEYMANLARTGSLAGKSQEQLAKESASYLTNMKVISSITGEDAKAAQKRANDAAMQSAVQAQLASMGGDATAKFQELIKVMPGMETAISQIMLTGSTTNAAVMNSPLFDIIKNAIAGVKDSSVQQGEVMKGVQNQLHEAGPALQQTIKEFSAAGVGALFGQQSEFATALQGLVGMLNQSKRSGDAASGAVDGQKTTTDKVTTETIKLQQEFEKARLKLQDELTPALGGFATQLRNTFKDVDKYVQTALGLMINKEKGGVNTPAQAVRATNEDRARAEVDWANTNEFSGEFAKGGVLTGPSSGYKPNITMHGTEAIVPLAGGGIPVESPALRELVTLLKSQQANVSVPDNTATVITPPSLNLTPLVEKMTESNQLLRSQLEMTRQMRASIEDGTGVNKQILSITR